MKNAVAFKGCYADWRLIKTRGCVQVVLEIPLHEADLAYQALGGMPDPASERWFGIARLDLSNVADGRPRAGGASHQPTGGRKMSVGDDPTSTPAPRLHKPVAPDKRLAAQAGIVCSDQMFWRYVEQCYAASGHKLAAVTSADEAAAYVRTYCEVASRSEIKPDTPEGEKWQELHGDFLLWRDAPDFHATQDHQGERV